MAARSFRLFAGLSASFLYLLSQAFLIQPAHAQDDAAKAALNTKLRARAVYYNTPGSGFWRVVQLGSISEVPAGALNLSGNYYSEDAEGRVTIYAPYPNVASQPQTIDEQLCPQADAYRRGAENKLRLVWLDVTRANWPLALDARRDRSIAQAMYDYFPEIAATWGYTVPANSEPIFSDYLYSSFRQVPAYIVGYYTKSGDVRKRHYFSDGSVLVIGKGAGIVRRLSQYQHWKKDPFSFIRYISVFGVGVGKTGLAQRATYYLHKTLNYPVGTVAMVGLPPGVSGSSVRRSYYTGPIAIYGYKTSDDEIVRFETGPVIVKQSDL